MDERGMLDLLNKRYDKVYGNGRRWAVAEHVKNTCGHNTRRIADLIAVDTWPTGGIRFHGHEVKVSRSDWLAELRAPDKAEEFKQYMDHWWLVVSDPAIVKPGELPAGWGLMAPSKGSLRVRVSAPRLSPVPMPKPFLASLLRATARTATRQAARTLETVTTVPTVHPDCGYRDMERPRRCDEHPEAMPTNVPMHEVR